ncbi:MAG TPA: hypothetical protein VFP63_03905 [Dehalococcoidia bacterium]|nr:hypothetical protein [Dehalococcoidia bacterium]
MFATIITALGTKVAAAATAAAFLAGGAAGASAALGGPNVADSVHEVLSESGHPGDSDSEVTELDGENSGQGHETCSEATQHALERLNELLADGRPVENAIEAIENCGNDDGDDGDDDDGDDEDGDEPRCREATQHALERLNELLEDGRPVENAIEAIENCGPGDAGGDGTDNLDAEATSGNEHGGNGKAHSNGNGQGRGGD